MREPEFSHATGVLQYRKWALENKKRADRLLAAAKAVSRIRYMHEDAPLMSELWRAATDYEDQIG